MHYFKKILRNIKGLFLWFILIKDKRQLIKNYTLKDTMTLLAFKVSYTELLLTVPVNVLNFIKYDIWVSAK